MERTTIGLHPTSIIRCGLVLIALTGFGFGSWAATAPLAGAIITRGVVKVDSNRKTVQHLEGGIVKEIRARDGERVEAGQTLIVLEDERAEANLDLVQGQLYAELAKAARFKAERDGQAKLIVPESLTALAATPKVAELLAGERSVLAARRQTLEHQIALLTRQIREAEAEITAFTEQIKAEEQALTYLEPEIIANSALEKRQMVARVDVLRLQRTAEEYRARRGRHQAEIARVRQRITDLQLKTAALRHNAIQAAADEFARAQARIADLEERLRPSRDAVKRQHITAPARGTVVELKVFTVGGVIAPRQPLLDIVPDDSPLIIEARVGVDSIDDLHPGMAAEVRLTAYPTRTTPLLQGQVVAVSADRLTDAHTGLPYYAASIQVQPESLAHVPQVRLYPGMPAEVLLKTSERTALEYLLQPLTTSLRRAFREP
jgi:HlyD family type I secretion membrane fusion protein